MNIQCIYTCNLLPNHIGVSTYAIVQRIAYRANISLIFLCLRKNCSHFNSTIPYNPPIHRPPPIAWTMSDRAPSFVEKPRIARTDGGDIEFSCTMVARPRASVQWSRQGQPLDIANLDPRLRVGESRADENDEDLYKLTLTLSQPCEDDSGSYSVMARNALGTMTANIGLNLR